MHMEQKSYYHSYHNRDRLVHIIDADAGTREALSVLFRLEGFQTTAFADASSFFAAVARTRPDVVALNLELSDEPGLEVLDRIKGLRAGIAVFMLMDNQDVNGAVEAMKRGATDIVQKPIDTERFIRLVRNALRRDVLLGTVQGGRRPIEIRGFNQLTPREREVLERISNGQSNKEAGRDLGISPRTIEVHRARVMEKLGARNTADLMRIVLTG